MSAPIDIALLAALRKEFAEIILPELGGRARYPAAMMQRALDVLWAQANAPEAPGAVLERAGLGTPEALAAALRREHPPQSPELAAGLRAYVEAKLRLSNPKFLAAAGAREQVSGT